MEEDVESLPLFTLAHCPIFNIAASRELGHLLNLEHSR